MEQSNIFIGLDLHKLTSTYCVKTKQGELLEIKTVKTKEKEFKTLANKYPRATIAFEPVSESWHYGDVLEKLGFDIRLAHARHVKALGRVKVKTDNNDAELLCDLLRGNLLPEAYRSSKEVRDIKELVRTRFRFIRIRTAYKNNIHAILRKHGLKAPVGYIFGQVGKSWIETLKEEKIFGTGTLQALELCLATITHINQDLETVESSMETIGKTDPRYNILTGVPGIGLITAMTILVETENMNRFKSNLQFVSYAGLAPNTIASGATSRFGRLRRGNPYLRFVFIQAAQHQKRLKDMKGFRSYYEQEKAKRNSKTATVATARKIAKVVHSMLVNNRPFDQKKVSCYQLGMSISTVR